MTLTLSTQALPWEDHEDSDDDDSHHDGDEGQGEGEGEGEGESEGEHAASPEGDDFENFLPTFLVDQLVLDEWQSMGLPCFLAESAAIASHVLRPICVDPQEQADANLHHMMLGHDADLHQFVVNYIKISHH